MEILECLSHVNRSIYGIPAIVAFIAGNISDIILMIYSKLIFPEDLINDRYHIVLAVIELLLRITKLIVLYGIGQLTEQEVFKYNIIIIEFLYIIVIFFFFL